MEDLAKSRGDVIKGKAKSIAPDAVETDDKRIEADSFVIATGSMTRPLSMAGDMYAFPTFAADIPSMV